MSTDESIPSASSTDPQQYFSTEHLEADLKGRSIRSGAVTMTAQACKFLLGLGSIMVLARLLVPGDFGLIAMVVAVTGFVSLFKDLGLSIATVQRAKISHEQISTLFWVNVLVGIVAMLATAALAPGIAWFYDQPQLTGITLVLATSFVFGGLTVQHQALLSRQMRFGTLAAIDVSALAIGIAVAVVSAKLGAGYWALVVIHPTIAAATAAGVWIACKWRPGRPVRRSGVRSMLAFGRDLTAFSIVNYFARNLDNVLIGWYWSEWHLGLYSKAYGLLMMPLSQINAPIGAVAVPTLSRLQNDPERLRNYYVKAVSLLTLFTTPLSVLFVVISDEAVELILGWQWSEAGSIFRYLAVAALVQPICSSTGWLFLATNRADRLLRWGLYSTPCILASFAVGLPYGPHGVALCYTVTSLLLTLPCLAYATRGTSVRIIDIVHAVKKTFLASFIAGAAALALRLAVEQRLPMWGTAVACSLAMALIFPVVMFLAFGTKDYYLSLLQEFKRR